MNQRIYLHSGLGQDEKYFLKSQGTLEDLEKYNVALKEGLKLEFYDYDAGEDGKSENLVFDDVLHWDKEIEQWYATI
jgi:hypothetical protein